MWPDRDKKEKRCDTPHRERSVGSVEKSGDLCLKEEQMGI